MESARHSLTVFLSSLMIPPSRRSQALMAAGLLALVGLVAIHKVVLTDAGLLAEGPPVFNGTYLLCSALILLSALCFVLAVLGWHPDRPEKGNDAVTMGAFERGMVAVALCISTMFVVIFLTKPATFSALSLEDGAVEWASALLLFGASGAFAVVFLRLKHASTYRVLLRLTAAGLAVLFFLIGMEEISWMQRVIGFETPQGFETNIQGEANLHNFITEPLEIVYYFSVFVFAVALPFMRWQGVFRLDNPFVALMVPRPFVVYLGAILCAYTFDMWNIFPIQWAFLFSVLALLLMLRSTPAKGLTVTVLGVTVVTQVIFLAFPSHYAREWEITEYREFFMPLAFLAYALDVMRRSGAYAIARQKQRDSELRTYSRTHNHRQAWHSR